MRNIKKIFTIYTLLILIFGYLVVNLTILQLVEGEKYYLIANSKNQREKKTLAQRGVITDRNGNQLAYNIASYSVYLLTNEFNKEDERVYLSVIAEILGQNTEDIYTAYQTAVYTETGKRSNMRYTVAAKLTYDQYYQLVLLQDKYPGLYVVADPIRYYESSKVYSNMIGYTADPNLEDVKAGIYVESQVGRVGIEKAYDQYLRGAEGMNIRERDPVTKEYNEYTVQEATTGSNLVLTIDNKWQQLFTKFLAERIEETGSFAGAGVIINSRTGEVMAMATYPGYDNNLFIGGISNDNYQALINDEKRPLFNRPIALQLPPGSTWKIIGAAALLESGIINENSKFFSNRCIELPGKITFCEANKAFIGEVDVKKALSYSSNLFFCNAAMELNKKNGGPEYLLNIASEFGVGKKTGIDLVGEGSGMIPSLELKKKIYNEPWYVGDDCNTVIGQGMVTMTPIQMAVATAAINNGGKVLQPYVVKEIVDQNGGIELQNQTKVVRELPISQKNLNIIIDGMRLTAQSGTASILRDTPGNNIAKTGSAQASETINGKRYTGAHSWTVGCFDYQGENYCYSVMMQWGGWGYKSTTVIKNLISCLYSEDNINCTY